MASASHQRPQFDQGLQTHGAPQETGRPQRQPALLLPATPTQTCPSPADLHARLPSFQGPKQSMNERLKTGKIQNHAHWTVSGGHAGCACSSPAPPWAHSCAEGASLPGLLTPIHAAAFWGSRFSHARQSEIHYNSVLPLKTPISSPLSFSECWAFSFFFFFLCRKASCRGTNTLAPICKPQTILQIFK